MDREGVVEFLKEIEGPNARIEHHSEWVSVPCPLRKYLHKPGGDAKSFGVHVQDSGESLFNCFTCKSKGTLAHLLSLLEHYTGEDYDKLKDEVRSGEFLSAAIPEWRGGRGSAEELLGEPLSEEYLDLYDEVAGHQYLKERGVSDKAALLAGLVVDPEDSKGDERILFPIRDNCNQLHGFTGRAVKSGVDPKSRDYFGLKKRLLLLGSHLINTEGEHVVLVEGPFDYLNLLQYGYPVVAALHSTLTETQADILREIGLPVVLMLDGDQAGRQGALAVSSMLDQYVPVYFTKYPKFTGKWYKEQKRGVDAGNLKNKAIKKMIREKELVC